MSRIEVVRRFYDAVERSDLAGVLSCLAENVVWHGPSPLVPAGRVYHGLSDLKSRWLGDFLEIYPEYWARPKEYVESEDLVIAIGEHGARISGVLTAMPMAHIWRVHGGKIVGARFFTDTAGMIEALNRSAFPVTPSGQQQVDLPRWSVSQLSSGGFAPVPPSQRSRP